MYVHILKAFGLASLVFLSTVHKCACSVFVDERVSCHLLRCLFCWCSTARGVSS